LSLNKFVAVSHLEMYGCVYDFTIRPKTNILKIMATDMLQMCVRAEGAMAKPPVATTRLKVPNTADVNTREVSHVTVATVVQPTPGSGWHRGCFPWPTRT